MHVHILGIGGTFMAGIAALARAAGAAKVIVMEPDDYQACLSCGAGG